MQRRYLLLAACVALALCASLPAFWSTPPGVLRDNHEYLPQWAYRRFTGVQPPFLYDWFWYHAGYRWYGYAAERVLGLGMACAVLALLVYRPITLLVCVPVVAAILCATRFGLWSQRHHLGMELVLAQVVLVGSLQRGRKWCAALVCACAPWLYSACYVWLLYPAIWWRRDWRKLVSCYGLLTLLLIPAVWNMTRANVLPTAHINGTWSLASAADRTWLLIKGFWDSSATQDAGWQWSYVGVQTYPPVVLAALVAGIAVAVWTQEGRLWVTLLALGLLPSLLGQTRAAASHREIMALLPTAVLCAWWLTALPQRGLTWALGIVVALALADAGTAAWHDPAFWRHWNGVGWEVPAWR